VSPSDLRVIEVDALGQVSQRIISQVRFSELEVPSDADIVMAAVRGERKARLAAPSPPSTFEDDAAAIASIASETCCWKGGALSSSPVDVLNGMPQSPGTIKSLASILREPDCVFSGSGGWEMSVHSAVLRQRCDHFRARSDSGMRDALISVVHVPDHFSQDAVNSFLKYLYHDKVDINPGNDAVAEVLLVAQYYGVARLVQLCEVLLAKELRAGQRSEESIKGRNK